MATSAQLERETEQKRARLAETLEELRSRATPGHLVDELTDYVRSGSGAMFVRNFREQCTSNPIAVSLMGAGLGWLLLSSLRRGGSAPAPRVRSSSSTTRVSDSASRVSDHLSGTAADMRDRTKEAGERLSAAAGAAMGGVSDYAEASTDAMRRSAHDARDKASGMMESAKGAVSSATESAAEFYDETMSQARDMARSSTASAARMGDNVVQTAKDWTDTVREQPLVLAGLGLALGALIGATLPRSETEDEMLGRTSDQLKDKAAGIAKETAATAVSAADQAAQAQPGQEKPDGQTQNMQAASTEPKHEATLVPEMTHRSTDSGMPDDKAERPAGVP